MLTLYLCSIHIFLPFSVTIYSLELYIYYYHYYHHHYFYLWIIIILNWLFNAITARSGTKWVCFLLAQHPCASISMHPKQYPASCTSSTNHQMWSHYSSADKSKNNFLFYAKPLSIIWVAREKQYPYAGSNPIFLFHQQSHNILKCNTESLGIT